MRDGVRCADVDFPRTVARLSENFVAGNIADSLFSRALMFARFEGSPPADAVECTLEQHQAIYKAIAAGEVTAAQHAMNDHIVDAWKRRSAAHRADTSTRMRS